MDKNLQKNSKAIQIHVFKNSFLTFLINFMFLTFFWFFCKKKKKKIRFFGQRALKKFFELFGQNSDNLDRFLVKFHSKLNIFMYHTILILKLLQQQFSPKVTKLHHITSMNERYVREFRDGREFRDVPELRVPPNLILQFLIQSFTSLVSIYQIINIKQELHNSYIVLFKGF